LKGCFENINGDLVMRLLCCVLVAEPWLLSLSK
jgi:hypothetical protein